MAGHCVAIPEIVAGVAGTPGLVETILTLLIYEHPEAVAAAAVTIRL